MKDIGRRLNETFRRVQAFGKENAETFPPDSFAGEQFAAIDGALGDLEKHTTAQSAGLSAARQGTLGRAAARDQLMRTLEAISRTARPIAAGTPGLIEKFRVPHNQNDQAVLASARAMAEAALPLKAEFIKRGMRPDFIEDLEADIQALDDAITHKIESRETHVASTAAIDDATERGIKALRELDPIMRNTFADDPAKLAAWLSAGHVERPARRQKKEDGKPTGHGSQSGTSTPPSGGA
jgi:hypothetical protein